MKIKSPKDFWAGIMFIVSGVFFLAWSFAYYQMGSAVRMGPGYFPAVLGGLLSVLGLIIVAASLVIRGPKVPQFHFRPLLLISISVVAYGYLMKPLGLVLATVAAVVIGALGGHEFKWKEVLILSLILVVFSVLVFVKGLTLPFPMCPEAMERCPLQ